MMERGERMKIIEREKEKDRKKERKEGKEIDF